MLKWRVSVNHDPATHHVAVRTSACQNFYFVSCFVGEIVVLVDHL